MPRKKTDRDTNGSTIPEPRFGEEPTYLEGKSQPLLVLPSSLSDESTTDDDERDNPAHTPSDSEADDNDEDPTHYNRLSPDQKALLILKLLKNTPFNSTPLLNSILREIIDVTRRYLHPLSTMKFPKPPIETPPKTPTEQTFTHVPPPPPMPMASQIQTIIIPPPPPMPMPTTSTTQTTMAHLDQTSMPALPPPPPPPLFTLSLRDPLAELKATIAASRAKNSADKAEASPRTTSHSPANEQNNISGIPRQRLPSDGLADAAAILARRMSERRTRPLSQIIQEQKGQGEPLSLTEITLCENLETGIANNTAIKPVKKEALTVLINKPLLFTSEELSGLKQIETTDRCNYYRVILARVNQRFEKAFKTGETPEVCENILKNSMEQKPEVGMKMK